MRPQGTLFALIDIRPSEEAGRPLLELMRSHLTEEARAEDATAHPQHRFEQLVERLNDAIAYHATEDAWQATATDVRALVGLCAEDTMFLTGVGDVTGLFLHKQEDGRYKIFNLFRSLHTETHIPSWQKLFSVVLDGDLHPLDVFVAGNRELLQKVDQPELLSIVSALPPQSAIEKLREFLDEETAVFILQAHEATSKEAKEIVNASASIDHFLNTQDTTRRLLESQRPRKKDWPAVAKEGTRFGKAMISSAVSVTLALLFGLIKDALRGVRALRGPNKFRSVAATGAVVGAGARAIKNHLRGLPRHSRKLLWIMAGFAVVFVGSLFAFSLRRDAQSKKTLVASVLEDVRDLSDTASASIIYNNEDAARQKLREGLALLDTLGTQKGETQASINALRTQLQESLDRLRHLVPVSGFTQIASLPAEETAVGFAHDGKTFFAFTESGSVFRYVAETSSFEKTGATAPTNAGTPSRIRYDDLSHLLYLFDGRQVSVFDPENNTYKIVEVGGLSDSTKDIDIYARRLYSLNAVSEQIFRHERDADRFGDPTAWINAKTISLTDAASFSIDGSAWVLKGDGQIVRYQKGLEQPWKSPAVDPAIPGSAILWTTDQTSLLYILDKTNKRVVVVDKETASLQKQLTHESFADLKGIWDIDGTLSVQTSNGLYQITQ